MIRLLGWSSGTGAPWTIEGIATDDVAEVWIERAGDDPVRVRPLMSLHPAGLVGQLFYVELPWEPCPTMVVALGEDGARLGEVPID